MAKRSFANGCTRYLACSLVVALLGSSCGSGDNQAEQLSGTATTSADGAEPKTSESQASQSDQQTSDGQAPEEQVAIGAIAEFTVEVIETYPHDTAAFTQGLEVDGDGFLLESTGIAGSSDLRRVDLETGEVKQIVQTPSDLFAEGATKVGDEVVQLTWQAGTAFYWDADTFELIRQVSYEGEGWGICFDGQQLIMTDGSAQLILRDPETFEETGRVQVTSQGQPVDALNEVECVDGKVWANRWTSDEIVGIDPTNGEVVATVDASAIRYQSDDENAVLNGIAWDESTATFLLVGKLWPNIYRVNFVEASDS